MLCFDDVPYETGAGMGEDPGHGYSAFLPVSRIIPPPLSVFFLFSSLQCCSACPGVFRFHFYQQDASHISYLFPLSSVRILLPRFRYSFSFRIVILLCGPVFSCRRRALEDLVSASYHNTSVDSPLLLTLNSPSELLASSSSRHIASRSARA